MGIVRSGVGGLASPAGAFVGGGWWCQCPGRTSVGMCSMATRSSHYTHRGLKPRPGPQGVRHREEGGRKAGRVLSWVLLQDVVSNTWDGCIPSHTCGQPHL